MCIDLSGDVLAPLLKLAREYARSSVIGTGPEHMLPPTFTILCGDGSLDIVMCPFGSDREKHVILKSVRARMRKTKARAYSFVSEAWMAHQPVNWRPELDPRGPPPSERPDRVETVFVIVSDGKTKLFQGFEIIRDQDGQVRELKESSDKALETGGLFAELL